MAASQAVSGPWRQQSRSCAKVRDHVCAPVTPAHRLTTVRPTVVRPRTLGRGGDLQGSVAGSCGSLLGWQAGGVSAGWTGYGGTCRPRRGAAHDAAQCGHGWRDLCSAGHVRDVRGVRLRQYPFCSLHLCDLRLSLISWKLDPFFSWKRFSARCSAKKQTVEPTSQGSMHCGYHSNAFQTTYQSSCHMQSPPSLFLET